MPQAGANRTVARFLVVQIIVLVALVGAVYFVGAQSREDLRKASEAASRRQTVASRAGCARGVSDRWEAVDTNLDVAAFALSAASARRASGDLRVAAEYTAEAARAKARAKRILTRVPEKRDAESVRRFCVRLFPGSAGD